MASFPTPDPNIPNTPSAPANAQTQQQPSTTPQTPATVATPDQSQMVSNPTSQVSPQTPTPQTPAPSLSPNQPDANHPSVQRAGVLRSIATALAGGPRYTSTVDPNTGTIARTQAPLSKGDLALAIVSEALSGSMAGLSVKPGPGNLGRAAGAGFQQVQSQLQDAKQQQQEQDQQNLKNQTQALAAKGAAFEQNSRAMLNTAQAERMGIDSLKDAVNQNASLLQSYDEAGQVQESNISQDQLMDGLKSGKYSATQQIAIPDGFTTINGKPEQTFSLIKNPSAKVPLTQDQWDQFASANVQGFTKGTKIPAGGTMVPGTLIARANHQMQANQLMQQDVSKVADALSNSKDKNTQELAQSIPDFGKLLSHPQTGPTLSNALDKFQKYVSHSDMHGMDLYQSLQQMAQPSKPNPANPKQVIPNGDAPLANTIAGAFGNGDPKKGWQILKAYSDEITPEPIKNVQEAQSITTDPTSTPREVRRAQAYIAADEKVKAAEKAKTAGAGTTGGVANSTLVDQIGTGHMVPERMAYLLSRNPALLEQVSAKYPAFDSSKAQSYPSTYKDFTSGKTSVALNAGGTALGHLKELLDLNTDASHIPGTPAWTRYQNKVDTVSTELARFYGDATIPGIASIKKTLTSTLPGNREAAIRTQAQSMGDKLDAYQQQWDNAAPSKAYEAPMPGISDKAKAARAALDPEYAARQATQSSGSSSQTQQPRPAPQQPRQLQIPAGAQIGRDANGNIVGYKLGGKYVPIAGAAGVQ